MAGICCGVVGESEAAAPLEPSSRGSIRRMLEPLPFKLVADAATATATSAVDNGRKRCKFEAFPLPCEDSISKESVEPIKGMENISLPVKESEVLCSDQLMDQNWSLKEPVEQAPPNEYPKFGLTSVCGRRRDMEDAVSTQPWLCTGSPQNQNGFHLFGVFDGHGCSHVSNCEFHLVSNLMALNSFCGELEMEIGTYFSLRLSSRSP